MGDGGDDEGGEEEEEEEENTKPGLEFLVNLVDFAHSEKGRIT